MSVLQSPSAFKFLCNNVQYFLKKNLIDFTLKSWSIMIPQLFYVQLTYLFISLPGLNVALGTYCFVKFKNWFPSTIPSFGSPRKLGPCMISAFIHRGKFTLSSRFWTISNDFGRISVLLKSSLMPFFREVSSLRA